jgi:polyhydroxyalkanoate synthesis regulator phasin
MDRRTLVMAGVVAGSVGLGTLVGAIAFAPGIGLAASDTRTRDGIPEICAGSAGSLDAAAEAIGVSTSELARALGDGRTIAEVADAHDVAAADVVDAVVAAEQDRLDQLIADGRLTQEQADELSADLEERVTELVNGDLAPFPIVGPPGFVGAPGLLGPPGAGLFLDGPIEIAAETIGIEADELLSAIRDGDTIADVARAHDVAVWEVVQAIVSSMQERLDQAVEDGRITQEEADRAAADLESKATDLVNGEPVMFALPGWGWSFDQGSATSTSEPSMF